MKTAAQTQSEHRGFKNPSYLACPKSPSIFSEAVCDFGAALRQLLKSFVSFGLRRRIVRTAEAFISRQNKERRTFYG
jgi:peptide subunit release factor RF-3